MLRKSTTKKQHSKLSAKTPLTVERLEKMYLTPFEVNTFKRQAGKFYKVESIGQNAFRLYNPYTQKSAVINCASCQFGYISLSLSNPKHKEGIFFLTKTPKYNVSLFKKLHLKNLI